MTAVATPHSRTHGSVWSRLSERQRIVGIAGFAVVVGVVASDAQKVGRALVGVFGLIVFVAVALSGRKTALTMILVWLVLLGFIRRLLIPFAGWSTQDPLLLVSPAAAMILWLAASKERRPPPRNMLASATLFLLVWTVAQIFNPSERSLLVGGQGALFYAVPLTWFFVGRMLAPDEEHRVMDTIFWANVPVLALGLYQSFIGFLPFELTWVGVGGASSAIFLPGFRIRPFSTLVSPQEYGIFLAIAIAVIFSRLVHARKHRLVLTIYLVLSIVALFLQASRSILLYMVVAVVVLALTRVHSVAVTLISMALLLGVYVYSTGSPSAPSAPRPASAEKDSSAPASGPVQVLVDHQVEGFSNPGQSTAPLHIDLVTAAFARGFTNPLGFGVSTGTIADKKNAEAPVTASAESDLANTTQALGLPGGLALFLILLAGFGGAWKLNRIQRTPRTLAHIGILIGSITQWHSGGLYCTSAIVFLCLGCISGDLASGGATSELELDPVESM